MVFSFLSFLVAIPSAIKVFNWTATLYKGSITFHTPMLYAFGFIGLCHHRRADRHCSWRRWRWTFTCTTLTSWCAHFHYIMVGGAGDGLRWAESITGGRRSAGGCTRKPGRACRR